MKMRALLICVLCCYSVGLSAQFLNGDFQSNAGYGCNAGDVWIFDADPTNYCEITDVFQPGNWWIDLTPCGDFGNGTWIEQEVNTIPGACYTVTMDIASYCGWDGSDSGIYLYVDGVQIGDRIFNDVFSCIPGTLGWGTFTSDVFTAATNSTTIRFVGEGRCSAISDPMQCSPLGGLGNPGVIGLDNIILNEVGNSPLAAANLPDVTICDNESVLIGEEIADINYLWSTGETTGQIEVNAPGVYIVSMTTECASRQDTVIVTALQSPQPFDLGPDQQFCGDFEVVLNAGEEVEWSTGVIATSITVNSPGLYSANSSNACGSVSDEVMIDAVDIPEDSFESEVLLCEGEFTTLSAPSPSAQWSNGETGASITVNTAGQFTAIFSNACGEGVYQFTVNTEPCGYTFYAPNSFTPDYDGLNDTWHPVIDGEVDKIEVSIFNRWGEEIWRTEQTNIHWTGQVRDGNYFVPDGVYVYRAEITWNTIVSDHTGHIVMIR